MLQYNIVAVQGYATLSEVEGERRNDNKEERERPEWASGRSKAKAIIRGMGAAGTASLLPDIEWADGNGQCSGASFYPGNRTDIISRREHVHCKKDCFVAQGKIYYVKNSNFSSTTTCSI